MMANPMKVSEQEIRQALQVMRSQPSHTGTLDYFEYVVDPDNEATGGWAEAVMAVYEYFNTMGLTAKEKRAALLKMMKEERNKRFTK